MFLCFNMRCCLPCIVLCWCDRCVYLWFVRVLFVFLWSLICVVLIVCACLLCCCVVYGAAVVDYVCGVVVVMFCVSV